METEPIEPGGFVLEGLRGDYSRSMGVFLCRGTFCRLASVGLPAKALTVANGSQRKGGKRVRLTA